MASLPPLQLAVLCLLLALSLLGPNHATQSTGAEPCNAVYWGQNRYEGGLREACATGYYKYVLVAFLNQFGGGQIPQMNLAGHCDPNSGGCTYLSGDIISCQQDYNVTVMLSLGGAIGSYGLASQEDAREVATYIYNSFLGGSSPNRPLGNAVLDGVDLAIQRGGPAHYDDLVRYLNASSTADKKVYLSAAPQCVFPDAHLQPAIDTGLLDYVWVQFYNNYCMYSSSNADTFKRTWNQWVSVKKSKVFLGLIASPNAGNGFVRPETLINNVLPIVKPSEKYGGIMIWNRYYDVITHFSAALKGHVCPDDLSFDSSMRIKQLTVI
ncbi:unnamed protein product [Musa textilis]